MRSNTLRVDDQVQYEDVCPQLVKTEPRHFSLPSLEQQFQENYSEYPQLREASAPSEEFLRSRDWASADLPDGAIGWGALPWFHFINPHQGLATKTVIQRLKQDRPMVDHSIKIPHELRRSAKTSQSLALLRQKQRGSIIILPIQLGSHHSGHSLSQVLKTMSRSEFCLGLVEVRSQHLSVDVVLSQLLC